jgi:hypothetical protein
MPGNRTRDLPWSRQPGILRSLSSYREVARCGSSEPVGAEHGLDRGCGATARQIADYAAGKGISYGFYMGCAAHGGEGNAAGLPFRPDREDWKKLDAGGRRAPDNCLGCDGFFEWWLQVQDRTIKKYRLGNWSWDPSRGSAMNCYDEAHGHVAGRGAYKAGAGAWSWEGG